MLENALSTPRNEVTAPAFGARSDKLHDWAGGQKEGIAILIRPRFNIRNHQHRWFPRSGGADEDKDRDFKRVIHAVSFTIGGHDLRAYNTHLDAHYRSYRGYQLGLFARMMNAHNGITIGGGDLNEHIGSGAYAPFGRRGLSQIGPLGTHATPSPTDRRPISGPRPVQPADWTPGFGSTTERERRDSNPRPPA